MSEYDLASSNIYCAEPQWGGSFSDAAATTARRPNYRIEAPAAAGGGPTRGSSVDAVVQAAV